MACAHNTIGPCEACLKATFERLYGKVSDKEREWLTGLVKDPYVIAGYEAAAAEEAAREQERRQREAERALKQRGSWWATDGTKTIGAAPPPPEPMTAKEITSALNIGEPGGGRAMNFDE